MVSRLLKPVVEALHQGDSLDAIKFDRNVTYLQAEVYSPSRWMVTINTPEHVSRMTRYYWQNYRRKLRPMCGGI